MVAVNVMNINTSNNMQPSKPPKLGWYIYLLSTMAVIGGFLFGYDTGIVSSALIYITKVDDFKPMSYYWTQLIVSITPGMAGLSALSSGFFSDRYGRRTMIIVSSFIFIIGGFICGIGINKYILLIGRTLLGVAIGIASMIVPIYVGEASPAHIRGKLVTGFQLMITFGLMGSNIIAFGFSYISPLTIGWRLMFGFAAVPAIIQFIGFFFLPESPRWLYENKGPKETRKVLSKIYNGNLNWIEFEFNEIKFSHEQQIKNTYLNDCLIWRIIITPTVRRALIVGCLLQAFQQISGINTIMYYTSSIIQASGFEDDHIIILLSIATSSVNFLCTFIPMFLIERLGRRKLLLSSVAGVIISLMLLSGSFYLISQDSAPTATNQLNLFNKSVPYFDKCASFSNCDYCVTQEECGFCSSTSSDGKTTGYCFPANSNEPHKFSSIGQCISSNISSSIANSRFSWKKSICESKYSIFPIILVVIYLCSFSIGYAPLPWVLNAEFYPLWARSTCVSVSTFFNWMFNLIVSMTFLTLMAETTKHGAFLIYAVVTTIAFIYFAIYVPETKGCSLNEVEKLFMTKSECIKANNQPKNYIKKSEFHEMY